MTFGFVALWRNQPREYHASRREELATTAAIHGAFARGNERGIQSHGVYDCRWSSAWQYLTFWLSPNLDAIVDTIADLERAGDFKFANSRHMVGCRPAVASLPPPREELEWVPPNGARPIDLDPPDGLPPFDVTAEEGSAGAALFLAWRRAESNPPALSLIDTPALVKQSLEVGARLIGVFDCAFAGPWERFGVWVAPTVQIVERYLDALERRGMFVHTDTTAVTGVLTRHYRFGTHLQIGEERSND
jgi:hypothetical protein